MVVQVAWALRAIDDVVFADGVSLARAQACAVVGCGFDASIAAVAIRTCMLFLEDKAAVSPALSSIRNLCSQT